MNRLRVVSKSLASATLVAATVSVLGLRERKAQAASETCLVLHAVTPVQVCRNHETQAHQFRFLGDGSVYEVPFLPSFSQLAVSYPDDCEPESVELYRGMNEGTENEVLVHYSVREKLLFVSASFVNSRPNATRAYILSIDQEGTVTHTVW